MGKKPKKGDAVVDDWENDVEEIEKEASGDKAPTPATVDDLDAMWSDDDKKKKKGKKGKPAAQTTPEPADDAGADAGEAGDAAATSTTVKTKAQKAAEKKQREKEKKAAQKSNKEAGPKADEKEAEEEKDDKKKKKGKKDEKEDKKPKRKGPPAAALKAMLDAQAAEDEARKQAEDEQRAREDAAMAKYNEERRLEQEKKDKKKAKEKARKERMKAEGTLLTKKEKVAKERAEQLKMAHGITTPTGDDASAPKARTKVLTKNQKKKLQEEERKRAEMEKEQEKAAEKLAEETAKLEIKEAKKQKVVKTESAESSDDWDKSSDEDEDDEDSESGGSDSASEADSGDETSPVAEAKHAETESESSDSSSDEEEAHGARPDDFFNIESVASRVAARRKYHQQNKYDYFRAPVVCVLGHVDTGKTKTLDNLRRTNVQDNEAGGITQQIGATNVPLDCIVERTSFVKRVAFGKEHRIDIPGLLIIDTPGHESFANLRSRGSSLCDVAILVVDIMHGLENQTRESIKLLKKNKTPFVVALNKIDRLYQWKTAPDSDIEEAINGQKSNTKNQFEDLYGKVRNEMAMEELNIKLIWEYDGSEKWEDDDMWVPVCPTSAHSGDGMGNLMAQVIDLAQTVCKNKITFTNDLKCTIMEVKAIEGLGKAVDAILVNGRLAAGDMVVLGGQTGPICTHIKQIYTPPANKDLRVKQQWQKHAKIKGATGIKLVGRGDEMDKALAGLPLYIARREDEVEYFKELLEREISHALKSIKLNSEGVYVQASTLGSLEALLEYLRSQKVKYSAINIGPINKRDIMKASTMLEHNEKYGVVLGFDVPVTRDAQDLADSFKPPIKIFTADIIYHLTDQFSKHLEDQKKRKQEELKHVAIFPAIMKILDNCVFCKRDPIIVGVKILDGQLRVGSPICVPSKGGLMIGTLSSIEVNSVPVEKAKKGDDVCIKIESTHGTPQMVGRHFEVTDDLCTKITREGIDALKEWFRDEMDNSDWNLCIKLKKVFKIL